MTGSRRVLVAAWLLSCTLMFPACRRETGKGPVPSGAATGPTFVRLMDLLDKAVVEIPPKTRDILAAGRVEASVFIGVVFDVVDDGIRQTDPPCAAKVMLSGVSRNALLAPPPASIRIPVEIPAGATLEVGVAAFHTAGGDVATPVVFTVSMIDKDGRERVLHTENMVPAATPLGAFFKDLAIDLKDVAAGRATLSLKTSCALAPESIVAAWACPMLVRRGTRSTRPNVILVSIDTLRADHLGCYGYAKPTSPFIDSLAARGTRFERAVSPTTWTLPAHMSMFTGDYPSRHGVDRPAEVLDPTWKTMPEVLRRSGYATAAITEGAVVSAQWGFHKGFDLYMDKTPGKQELDVSTTADAAVRWVRENGRYPFFLFFHTYQPHTPLTPPAPYDTMFDADYPGRYDGRNTDALNAPAVRPLLTPRDIDHIVSLYDGEIRYTDDKLRSFIEAAQAGGLLDNTYIIFMSDHGEEYNERGFLAEHGKSLFNEVIRIPLFFVGPGIPARVETSATASLVDMPKTVFDLLGISTPLETDGRSLAPFLGPAPPFGVVDPPLYAELNQEISQGICAVIRGREKIITDLIKGETQAFDVTRLDPEKEPKPAPPEMTALLKTYMEEKVPGLVVSFAGGGAAQAQVAIRTPGRIINAGRLAAGRSALFGVRDNQTVLLGQLATSAPGEETSLFFNLAPASATIEIDVRVDGRPIPPGSVVLGASGITPDKLPFVIKADADELAGSPSSQVRSGAAKPMLFLWRTRTRHAAAFTSAPDEETLKKLRTLGYIQ